MSSVSFIVPVYNSSANLNKLSKEIRSNVKKQLNYEILLVNDFSVDDSWNIIKHLSKKNRNIRGINLKKNYGSKEAVRNISFEIKENEILGLLGPNGSGKTTTIGMLLGLLKPSNGEILIDGKKIEENRIEILKKINFISPYIELPKKLTVKQNLIVYCKLYKVSNIKTSIKAIRSGVILR